MNQSTLTYIKLGIVAVAVAGVFGMAIAGRITPDAALNDAGLVVTGLVAALGISSAGSAIGAAMRARAQGSTEIKP
jgi:hypothetical protein